MSQQPPNNRNSESSKRGSADGAHANSNPASSSAASDSMEPKRPKSDDSSSGPVLLDAAESSAPSSSPEHVASSPMLRLLGRDTGAQCVLLRLLDWPDCAALHRTGRSWRAWIDRAPITPASGLLVWLPDFASLSRCRWVQRFLTMLEVISNDELDGDEDETAFSFFLDNVHCLPRLESMHLAIPASVQHIEADSAQRAFTALTKLSQLVIDVRDPQCDPVLHVLLAHVHLLPSLVDLEIMGAIGSIHDLDFSRLHQCPKLERLRVASELDEDEDFRLSPRQFRDIARCKTLTELDVGVLSWATPDEPEAKRDDQEETKWIDENVGLILAAKQSAGASSGVPALKHLILRTTAMTPLLWDRLVLHPELEELEANSWQVGMSAAQWSQLALFTHLTRLAIHPHPAETRGESDFRSVLRVEEFLEPLLKCAALTSLTLGGGLEIVRPVLESIASKLPLLKSLELNYTYLESLDPLHQCPHLESLSLSCNTNLAYEYLQYRPLIPALPHLTSLCIDEREDDRLSSEAAAPLNAALLARCPLLTMDNFKQRLSDEEDDASDADASDEEEAI